MMKKTKTIVIVGTLDTKGAEIEYLMKLIEARKHRTIVINAGVLGEPMFHPDISAQEVAEAAGITLEEVVDFRDWKKASEAMSRGAKIIAQRLYYEGRLDGIIGIGGTMGTTLGAIVMKALPLFLPKIMVSTVTFSPFFHADAVGKDLIMIPTMVELAGGITSGIIRTVIENAAGAICGMVENYQRKPASKKPVIGITSFGMPALRFDEWAMPLLAKKGWDVAVFPGAGSAFEEAVEAGLISGALDIMAGAQLVNEICGGINVPSRIRFEAGKKKGIPQVFAPGVLELFSCRPPIELLPSRLKGRKMFQRSAFIVAVQTSKEELAKTGEIMAQKLNEMTGPTAMILPLQGFSEWDKSDTAPNFNLWNPEGRLAFIESFKSHVGAQVKVVELNLHIDDPIFVQQAVALLDEMMPSSC